MNRIFSAFLIITLFTLESLPLLSQANKYGAPISIDQSIDEYSPESQFWNIVQDDRGIIYAGSDHGLWEYDGYEWKYIKTPMEKGHRIRSLTVDDNGVVYVGMSGEFGQLIPNELGHIQYESLTHLIDTAFNEEYADVWKTLNMGDRIGFCTEKNIFEYDRLKTMSVIPLPEHVLFVFKVEDTYLTSTYSEGLKIYRDREFISPPNGEFFIEHNVSQFLHISENDYFIATFNHGMFRYNIKSGFVKPLAEFDETSKIFMTDLKKIEENKIAVSSVNNGLLILDSLGTAINVFSPGDITLYTLYKNEQRKFSPLWIGTSQNITRIDHSLPVQQLTDIVDAKNYFGIKMLEFENDIYVVSGGFIFHADKRADIVDYSQIPNVRAFELARVHNENGFYITSVENQIFWITDGEAHPVLPSNYNDLRHLDLSGLQIDQVNKAAFIFTDLKIITYRIDGKKWIMQEEIAMPEPISTSIQTFSDNLIFFNNWKSNLIYCLDKDMLIVDSIKIENAIKQHYFTESDNLLLRINNEVVLIQQGHFFSFNSEKRIFNPDPEIQAIFNPGIHDISQALVDQSGNVIISFHEQYNPELPVTAWENQKKKWWIEVHYYKSEEYIRDTLIYNTLPNDLAYIDVNMQGILIVQYPEHKENYTVDYSIPFKPDSMIPSQTLIRSVSSSNDSVLFHGTFHEIDEAGHEKILSDQPLSNIPVLSFKYNDIEFTLSSDNYSMINNNQYRYRLLRHDSKWSEWDENNIISYTNLNPGRYEFQAQTSNMFSQEGSVTSYTFVIKSPWYLAIWMIIIYLLALAAFIWLIIKLNSKRLILQKQKLEVLVDERTVEIRNQTEEILSQRDEIEAQRDALMEQKEKIDTINVALTDSIKYARRIQDAVMPPADVMRFLLPKHFVFYRPRDIVSGDFFWVDKKDNQVLLALGDCTGHGVPGAFMSMLGISLLTEISNKVGSYSSDEIMNELREQVILSLKQTGEADEAKDGMDMALVNLNTKTLELQYTGANLNLYLFQSGKLKEIKGDRMPVGIHSKAGKMFVSHNLKLKKGDSLYLTSDGFPDQFGGDLEKKYGYRRMRSLLQDMQEMIMHDQMRALSEEFDSWKGNIEQIDDVLVIGIKV